MNIANIGSPLRETESGMEAGIFPETTIGVNLFMTDSTRSLGTDPTGRAPAENAPAGSRQRVHPAWCGWRQPLAVICAMKCREKFVAK